MSHQQVNINPNILPGSTTDLPEALAKIFSVRVMPIAIAFLLVQQAIKSILIGILLATQKKC